MTILWLAERRWRTVALAAMAAAAVTILPATPGLAQERNDVVGPVVGVEATGGDVRVFGGSVTVSGAAANVRAAGGSVDVTANAAGSVWAFGGKVVLRGGVGADVTAAGSALTFSGRAGGDAQFAGGSVVIDGSVGGNLRACGANLVISPLASVAGRLEAAGASVLMAGQVTGKVKLYGAAVTFNGDAGGSVTLTAAHVVVGPRAHIGGDLTVYSRDDPDISPDAVISGNVIRGELPQEIKAAPDWLWGVGLAAAMVLGTILAGIVLMLFGGRLFITATDYARLRPVSTILVGLVTLVLVPAIAMILAATVVGIPIGLALLLALPLLFVFGQPVAAAGIAAGIFVRHAGPIGIVRAFLFVILGAIIIALISLIPWVGALAVGVVMVLGVGGLVRTAGGRMRTPRAAIVAPVAAVAAPAPAVRAVAPPAPPPPPPPPPPPEPPSPQPEPEKPAS